MIRLEKIIQLVMDDVPDREIARILHCDIAQVSKIRRKLGVRPSSSVISRDVYSRMLECGLSDRDVVYVFGMTLQELDTWKVREGVAKVPVAEYN